MINFKPSYQHLLLFLICLPLLSNAQTTYYSKGSGDFTNVNSWEDASGSGTSPSVLNDDDIFIIESGDVITLDGDVTVASIGVDGTLKLDGTNTLSIQENFSLYGTITHTGESSIKFITSSNSIIEGNKTINFKHLSFEKSGGKVIINSTRIIIDNDFTITSTAFQSKDNIYLRGDLNIDENSSFTTEIGNYLLLDGTSDQLIKVPSASNIENGNEYAQFSNMRFQNGGVKTIEGDLYAEGELQVYHHQGTKVEFSGGGDNYNLRNILLFDNKANTNAGALEFNGGTIYTNANTVIYHRNEDGSSTVGQVSLGTIDFVALNGNLTFGDNTSLGDEIAFTGNIELRESRALYLLENTVLNTNNGDLIVGEKAQVFFRTDDIPSFNETTIDITSTFHYQATTLSTEVTPILPFTYGHLRLYNSGKKNITEKTIVRGNLGVYDDAELTITANMELEIRGNIENRRVTDVQNEGTINAPDGIITLKNQNVDNTINVSKGGTSYKIGTLNITSDSDTPLTKNRNINIYQPLELGTLNIENTNGSLSSLLSINTDNTNITISDGLNQNDYTRIITKSSNPTFLKVGTNNENTNISNKNAFVYFNGNTQTIPSLTYGNLQFAGGGNKQLEGDLIIKGRIERLSGSAPLVANSHTIDIYGNWEYNTSQNYSNQMDGSTVNFIGTADGENPTLQIVKDATFGNVNFKTEGQVLISRPITITGDLTIEENANTILVDVIASEPIYLRGDWTEIGTNVKFSQTNGRVELQSITDGQIINQNIENSKFNDLWINSAFEATFNTKVVIDNELRMQSGKGSLNILNELTVNGHFYNLGGGNSFTQAENAILILGGSSKQSLRIDDPNQSTFTELVRFTGEGTKEFYSTNAATEFTFEKGIEILGSSVNAERRTINIKGNWVNKDGQFNSDGIVNFNGGIVQTVDPTTFYNLTIEEAGTKVVLDGTVSIINDFTQATGTTLNANKNTITIARNWNGINGTFEHGDGTVIFTGSHSSLEEDDSFYNFISTKVNDYQLNINQASLNPLYIDNNLQIIEGSLIRLYKNSLFVGGDYLVEGRLHDATKITLNASDDTRSYSIKTGESDNNNTALEIATATSSIQYFLNDNFKVEGSTGSIDFTSGILNLNSYQFEVTNANRKINIESDAELLISAGSILDLPANTSNALEVRGTLSLEGDPNNYALIEGERGAYNILIDNGGTLNAEYYKISDLGGTGLNSGIQFASGSILNPIKNFNNGIFVNGSSSSDAYITVKDGAGIITDSPIAVNNVTFAKGPANAITNKSSIIEVITFHNAKGTNKGKETLPLSGKIAWTYDSFIEWTGNEDNNWHEVKNWNPQQIPTKDDNVIIQDVTTTPVISSDAIAKRIEIATGATLNVNSRLEAFGGIFINNSGNLIGGSDSGADSIIVYGDWMNEGNFTPSSSPIRFAFDETTDPKAVSFIPGTDTYFSIVVDAVKNTVIQSDNTLKVDFFEMKSGAYDVSDSNINLYDTWIKTGGYFEYRKSTVTSYSAKIKGGDFFNLNVANDKELTLEGNVTVNNTIKLGNSSSVFNGGAYLIYLNGSIDNTQGGSFTHNGTMILNGAYQKFDGVVSLENLIIQGVSNKDVRSGAVVTVNGDLTLLDGIGSLFLREGGQLLGTNAGTFTMTGGTVQVYGSDNYPSGFNNYQLTGGSFQYRANLDQDVLGANYYNLYLLNKNKNLLGDINVVNELRLDTDDSKNTSLIVNDHEIAIGSRFTINGSSSTTDPINWGTGTLRHYGGAWDIPANLKEFHNLVLGGKDWKRINSNITISGDLTIEDNITFYQGREGSYYTIIGQSNKTLTMLGSSRYFVYPDDDDELGFADGFGTYNLDINTSTYIYSTEDRAFEINSDVEYGNLYLRDGGYVDLSGDLVVKGFLDERLSGVSEDFNIRGRNLYVGKHVILTKFGGRSTGKLILNGNDESFTQYVDLLESDIEFQNIEFSGQSVKELNRDPYTIAGDVIIKSDAVVTSNKNISFSGDSWTVEDGGMFTTTSGELTIEGESTLNFGNNHTIRALRFNSSDDITIACDLNVDYSLVVENSGNVDFGSYTHKIGAPSITLGANAITASTNFNFDGGNQNIPNGFEAYDVKLSNAGTKTLLGNISAHTITALNNTRLNPQDNSYIKVSGNWDFEKGYFNTKKAIVEFDGEMNNGSYTILQRANTRFYDIRFGSTNGTIKYSLLNNLYTSSDLNIPSGATLDVNGYLLYVGIKDPDDDVSDPIENITVDGELAITNGGILHVNGQDTSDDGLITSPKLEVNGTLRVIGSEGQLSKINTVSRASDFHRLKININTGGTIAAKFYELNGLDHGGLVVDAGASVDDDANFSEGVFTGMSTNNNLLDKDSNPVDRIYLVIDASVTNAITNITFDYNGTPNVNNGIYNVKRTNETNGIVEFAGSTGIAGSIKGATYEWDGLNKDKDLIEWPTNTDLVWYGGTSNDWFTLSNWKKSDGYPGVAVKDLPNADNIPNLSTNVILPSKTSASSFYPVISGTETALSKDLILQGGRLTLSSDLVYDLKNEYPLDNDGNVQLLDNSTGDVVVLNYADDYTPTAGNIKLEYALKVGGDILLESGLLYFENKNAVKVSENYSVANDATFEAGEGLINLSKNTGTVVLDQNNSAFNNLIISGNATITLQSILNIDGDFMITNNGGITLPERHLINFKGDVVLSKGASFDTNIDGNIYLAGTDQILARNQYKRVWFQGGRYTVIDSLVIKDIAYLKQGTIAQNDKNSFYKFYNRVEVNNKDFKFEQFKDGGTHYVINGRWIATGDNSNNLTELATGSSNFIFQNAETGFNIEGDHAYFDSLTLDVGTLTLYTGVSINSTLDATNANINLQSNTISGSTNGDFILGEKALYYEGTDNFPSGFNRYRLDENSTVDIRGGIDQNIRSVENSRPIIYGNITVRGESSTKTIDGDLIVKGDLTVYKTDLDVNSKNVALGGNLNYNYSNSSLSNLAELIFNGDREYQYVTLSSERENIFKDIIVKKPTNTRLEIRNSNLTIQGDLTVLDGIFNLSSRTAILNKNLTVVDGQLAESGSYIMEASSTGAKIQTNGSKFRGLLMKGAPLTTYEIVDNIEISNNYNLEIERGTLSSSNAEVKIGDSGQLNIGLQATYNVGEGGILTLGNNATVDVAGRVNIVGTAVNPAVIKSRTTGNYNFNIDGKVNAKYYDISGMDVNGVFVKSEAEIDENNVGYNFSDGTFSNYKNGGVALRIENKQQFKDEKDGDDNYISRSINNVNFVQHATSKSFNVAKDISEEGEIVFYNSKGTLTGEKYEKDPRNLITWTNPNEYVWTGAVDSDWNNKNNWLPSTDYPKKEDDVIIEATTIQPIIDEKVEVNNLTLETASLLKVGSTTEANALTVYGSVELNGQIEVTDSDNFILLYRNWIVNTTGSFLHGSGTLKTVGESIQQIDNAGLDFGNVVVADASYANMVIKGSESITGILTVDEEATLNISSAINRVLKLEGNLQLNGTFINGQNTLEVTKATTFFTSAKAPIYKLRVNTDAPSSAVVLSSDISVTNNLDIASGILNVGANNLVIGETSGGSANINGGELSIEGGNLKMADLSSFIMNSGQLTLKNGSRVTGGTLSARYSFLLDGGVFDGEGFTFEQMDEEGITFGNVTLNKTDIIYDINFDGTIEGDGSENFDVFFPNAVFQKGLTSGVLLQFKSTFAQSLSPAGSKTDLADKFFNISFNGSSGKNVLNSSAQTITFSDARGLLAGSGNEPASNGTIVWEETRNTFYWIGSETPLTDNHASWKVADNWSTDEAGTIIATEYPGEDADKHANNAVVIIKKPKGDNLPAIIEDNSNLQIFSLTVEDGAGFIIKGDASTMDKDKDDGSHYELVIKDDFIVSDLGYVDFIDALVKVEGRIINDGTFKPNTSILVLKPENKTVNLKAGENYYDLFIEGNANTVINLEGNVNVSGHFSMTNGTLNGESYILNLEGDVSIASDVILNGENDFTISLNGTGDQSISSDKPFKNLSLNGSGKMILAKDLEVEGDISFDNEMELDLNGNKLSLKGNLSDTESNGTITSNGGTLAFTGSDLQSIIIYGSQLTLDNLELANTSSTGVRSNINLEVNNMLTLTDGLLSVEQITLKENATVSGGSSLSYIIGKFYKEEKIEFGPKAPFTFPVGSIDKFAPVELTIDRDDNNTYYVEFIGADRNINIPVDGMGMELSDHIWDIHRVEDSNSSNNYGVDIKLMFEDLSPYTITSDISKITMVHYYSDNWNVETSTWTNNGDGTGNVYATGINSFSEFGATLEEYVDENVELPVELTYFVGSYDKENETVTLEWETASEQNASHFEIERSFDGIYYEVVGEVKAEGNSATINQYSYEDKVKGKFALYRLVQVDLDEQYTIYAPITIVLSDEVDKGGITIYATPNPLQGQDVYISLTGLYPNEKFVGKVLTTTGKEVTTVEGNANSSGISTEKINVEGWGSGMYILKIRSESGNIAFIKLIK